jgi:hypothetical protein
MSAVRARALLDGRFAPSVEDVVASLGLVDQDKTTLQQRSIESAVQSWARRSSPRAITRDNYPSCG